jgi:hypothetical protein
MKKLMVILLVLMSGCVQNEPDVVLGEYSLEQSYEECLSMVTVELGLHTEFVGLPWVQSVQETSHVMWLPFEDSADDWQRVIDDREHERAYVTSYRSWVVYGDSLDQVQKVVVQVEGTTVAQGDSFTGHVSELELTGQDVMGLVTGGFELELIAVGVPPAERTRVESDMTMVFFKECGDERARQAD